MSDLTIGDIGDAVVSGGVPTCTDTTSDLIEETRNHLYTGSVPPVNRLDADITSAATTAVLDFSNEGIGRGKVISIDLEDILVWEMSGTTISTMQRAQRGTAAAAHSALTPIYAGDRFSSGRILRALNNVLKSLSSPANGLFQMREVAITFNSAIHGYDLAVAPDMIGDPYLVRRKPVSNPEKEWPIVTDWSVGSDFATADFASTRALFIRGGTVRNGETIRVMYKAPFTGLSTISDNVNTTTGLPCSAMDIPPLGAAIRLTAGREIKRNFTEAQPDPRRAGEVPPGANAAAPRPLLELYRRRVQEEAARLYAQYPEVTG